MREADPAAVAPSRRSLEAATSRPSNFSRPQPTTRDRRSKATRSVARLTGAATVAIAIALLLAVAQPSAALAHAELVSSTPADGAELIAPPAEIRLVFSETPRLDGLSIRLFDRQGTEVAVGKPARGPLATTVVVSVPSELRPGPYTVIWSVVSAEDEHPESNEFVFGMGEPAAAPSVTSAELSDGAGSTLLPASTLLAILGLTIMLGSAVQARGFGLYRPRVVGAGLVGVGLVAVSMLVKAASMPRPAAIISDGAGGLLGRADPADVTRVVLLLVFVAAVLVAGQARTDAGRRHLWLAALLAGVGLAWVQAASSHAAGVGILPWVGLAWRGIDLAIAEPALYSLFGTAFELGRQLNILVAAVHAVAVGAWVGGLLVISAAGLASDDLAAWQPRFSRFALQAFLVVAASGLYQAVLYLPSPAALVGTEYGQTLVAKHLFVVGVLAMAGINRFITGPALRSASNLARAAGRARFALRGEALIGLGVIVVTGILATTPPARPPTTVFLRPEVVAAYASRRTTMAGDQPGVELSVSPVSATQHEFELTATTGLASGAVLTLYQPETKMTRDLPLQASGGAWRTEGLAFPRDGEWVASVSLVDGREANFRLEVGFGRVLPYDPAARSVWDRAIERTETGMRSARMIDQLTDGVSVMLFGHHEFESPDRERFDMQGRFSSVTADGRRYTREAGSAGWTAQDAGDVKWPSFDFLRTAIGVTAEGTGSQAGKRCEVLAATDPQSDVTYELWVGQDDGMIHRLVMGVPGHYMVNAYYDVNEPVDIQLPATAVPAR